MAVSRSDIFLGAGCLLLLFASVAGAQTELPSVGTSSERPKTPPLPPTWQSPINYFRKLLVADDTERSRLLANKSPSERKILLHSLREYQALTTEVREARLRALDLRACLTPLLRLSPTNRAEHLVLLPNALRSTVEARLALWDLIPAESQRLVVENESIMRLLVSSDQSIPQGDLNPSELKSEHNKLMETEIGRWRQLSPATREQIFDQFQRIFDASDLDREHVLAPLNALELRQVQSILDKFRNLPKDQRDACLEGFRKFTDLSPYEQHQFLLSASEWQRMSDQDRQLCRDLITRMPPYPPGFHTPPLPPLPLFRPNASVQPTNP